MLVTEHRLVGKEGAPTGQQPGFSYQQFITVVVAVFAIVEQVFLRLARDGFSVNKPVAVGGGKLYLLQLFTRHISMAEAVVMSTCIMVIVSPEKKIK